MLKRLFTYALSISFAGVAISGCGDGGGKASSPDAALPDAPPGPNDSIDAGIDAGSDTDAGTDHDLTIESIAGGQLETLADYEDIVGAAHLVRMAEALRAELYVEGLTVDTDYVAHVHKLPCDQDQGGEHYKHDPAIEAELEDNEIWLRFTTDADGRGVASSQQLGQVARGDAQSIVVHDNDADETRMACANLFFDDPADAEIALQGGFSPDPDAPVEDQDIGGSVSIMVSVADDETFINLDLEGLDEAASYVAYVHELPCEVNEAGGHYKRDTTVEEEDNEDNEIRPDLDQQEQTFPHALRYDAQSLVLHRVADGEQRVACANLVRMTEIPEYITEGEGGALPDVDSPFEEIEATARLERKRDGTTAATLEVTGLPDDAAELDAYVHAGTCNLDPPGGPRYKLDPEVTAEAENNEIWLGFAVDGEGGASSSNGKDAHLARPDAVSVIIHAPGTDARLSCIELR